MSAVQVGYFGFPDLTSAWRHRTGDACQAQDFPGVSFSLACTRRPGHTGSHSAGNGEIIVAVWPNERHELAGDAVTYRGAGWRARCVCGWTLTHPTTATGALDAYIHHEKRHTDEQEGERTMSQQGDENSLTVAPVAVDADKLAEHLEQFVCEHEGRNYESPSAKDIAEAIREHLPAATRPALPEGHVAVDVSDLAQEAVEYYARTFLGRSIYGQVACAELARRAAEAGEAS